MRVSTLSFLVVGAGLAQYVAASPLRVVVVTNHEVSGNVRYINTIDTSRPLPPFPLLPETVDGGAGRHHPCHGMKDKALAISNKFREVFGLPTIDPHAGLHKDINIPQPPADFRIMPFVPMGGLPEDAQLNKEDGIVRIAGHGHIHGMGGPPHHHFHRSFLHRVHRALMILGPWEGRAVAFVLGCGIGVLLRMMWVMTIVVFRALKGSRRSDEDDFHEVLVFEADAEDILVPPPQYTDEKVALVAAEHHDTDVKA